MNQMIRDLQEKYRVDPDGIIRKEGKYEGEMYYVPYFWEQRTPDSQTDTEKTFKLSRKEQLLFSDLEDIQELTLQNNEGIIQETSKF